MSSIKGRVPPEIKLDLIEGDAIDIARNTPEGSLTPGRPRSEPSPLNLTKRQNERKGSADFRYSVSSVLQDIEGRQSANDERKLQALLASMKNVKGSTLFQMLVVTFMFHIIVYVSDVVTDFINGENYYITGKNKAIFIGLKIIK